ncbi:hypothetical protein [Burkholderia cepacia]|uniref:hypothetical protein n=1 Tax=Burkholderia cepacia TaxID=292 RepID=UPI002AB71055|nr:hypothetical protein [Burkholderia cepacia]
MDEPTGAGTFLKRFLGALRKPRDESRESGLEATPSDKGRFRRVIPIASAAADEAGFQCPPGCWGTCCDGTVMLEPTDVTAIMQFANKHFRRFAEHFGDIFVLFGMDGEKFIATRGMVQHGSATRFAFFRNAATSEMLGDLPASGRVSTSGQPFFHTVLRYDRSTDTIGGCVFLTENRTCFLEEVAVEAGEHRWSGKPEGCVLFPLVPGNDGALNPLQSPVNQRADSPHHGLLHKLGEKACCQAVGPENAGAVMQPALKFIVGERERRKKAFEAWLRTKATEIRNNGFLASFDRPSDKAPPPPNS